MVSKRFSIETSSIYMIFGLLSSKKKGRNTMKNNINETMSKYTAGEITL